jgi:hypothetical protein
MNIERPTRASSLNIRNQMEETLDRNLSGRGDGRESSLDIVLLPGRGYPQS